MRDWQAVLGALNEGVVVTRPSSEIVWANEAYCSLTGYRLEELVGRTPRLVRSSHARPEQVAALWDTLSVVGRAITRVVDRRADGSTFHAELSLARLEDREEGTLYVGVLRDVSLEAELEEHLERERREAEKSRDITIVSLASLAEQRDRTTGAHLARIEAYVRRMMEHLLARSPERFPPWARDPAMVARCSILHDIGKVGIPDRILLKEGPLDREEQAAMKEHPRLGAEILDRVLAHAPESAFLLVARDIVKYHHESWDGRGYPYGLAGDEIPLVAQVTTVADVFDALTSKRPYKPAYPFDEAAEYVRAQAGVRLGPLATEAFFARLGEMREVQARLGDEATGEHIQPSGIDREPVRSESVHLPEEPPSRSSPLLAALREAMQHPAGGEVLARCGELVGRVLVWQGRIAWIASNTGQDLLSDELAREAGLSAQEFGEVVRECQRTGRDFAGTLLDWGLVDGPRLAAALKRVLSRRLSALLALEDPVSMFVPTPRTFEGAFTFALEELVEAG